jgi:outer membrane protein assembly factor BamB
LLINLLKQKTTIESIVLLLIISLGIIVFAIWFFYNPVQHLSTSLPGLDNRPAFDSTAVDSVIIGEKFREYETYTSTLTGKWTRFRGADYDNIYKGPGKFIDKFDTLGPKILWQVELGEGHAAPVIYNGRVYLLDYDERKKNDALRCFSLETGKELWRRWYAVNVKRNHGMSRTVPAITDKYIVTIGPKCHVMCCDPITGKLIWGIDLVKEYKAEVPLWYTGQCPLIENDIVVLAPGGKALLIGVDCKTGKVVWQTPNPGGMKMSHSSVMPMNFEGKKMYVYAAIGGVCGISAEGTDRGKILWRINKFNPSVMAPSPLVLPGGKIFLTAGYGAGAAMLQVVKTGTGFDAKVVQIYKPSEGLASEQQTPVFYKGFIFGILPKDAGTARNQFVCYSPNDCKKMLWTSSKTDRYGLGPYIIADGKFFILSDDGTLTIAKAQTSGFEFLDKAKIMDGQDAWGPMAIADGRLLLRDSKLLVCIDIQKK